VRLGWCAGRADYFGQVLNRAARLHGAAHGGQILAERGAVLDTMSQWRDDQAQAAGGSGGPPRGQGLAASSTGGLPLGEGLVVMTGGLLLDSGVEAGSSGGLSVQPGQPGQAACSGGGWRQNDKQPPAGIAVVGSVVLAPCRHI
jgi:hypothetical protein